jgi:hypothetical protein
MKSLSGLRHSPTQSKSSNSLPVRPVRGIEYGTAVTPYGFTSASAKYLEIRQLDPSANTGDRYSYHPLS